MRMGSPTGEANINGITVNSIQVNGKKELNMDLVCGKMLQEIPTWASGGTMKHADLEFLHQSKETTIKGSFNIA